MWGYKNWRRRRLLQRNQLPADIWQQVVTQFPVLQGLRNDERNQLREMAIILLAEKSFLAADGLELDTTLCISIAAQACLPVLNLGLDYYRDWQSVIVYPTSFRVPYQYTDSAGVVHSGHAVHAGEAWERGPLVIAWEEVQQAAFDAEYNVVIHECAHKLDMLNGAVNGMPPLHASMSTAAWCEAFTAAYAELRWRVDEHRDTVIHPYAATSPAEFFAVVSELFFSLPVELETAYPAVYGQLRAFYRQDPKPRRFNARC